MSSVKDFVTSPWRDNDNVALNRPIRIKRDGGYVYKYHLVVELDLTFNDSIILQKKKTDEGSCKDKEKNKRDGKDNDHAKGDVTPDDHEYTKHGADRANERGFTDTEIDNIIRNNDPVYQDNSDTYLYKDPSGNAVDLNSDGDIVTVYR